MNGLKHSGRRAFLRGAAGAALALPALEFTHGHAWAAGDDATCRFLTVFTHGGTISNQNGTSGKHNGSGPQHGLDLWRPADPSSESLVLGPIHEPLAAFRDKLVLLESIDNRTGLVQGAYGGGHRRCNVTALTAADIGYSGAEDEENAYSTGPSIDQVIAERLAQDNPTAFENVHLRVHGHQYGSPYFRADNERVSGERNPGAAFAALFDGVVSGEPDPEILRANNIRRSVLNGLSEEYDRFRNKVSAKDLQAIDAHLDHLAALEAQLDNLVVCTPPSGIPGDEGATPEVADLHADIIVAALRCGLTNVANLEISDIVTPWTPAGNPTGQTLGHGLHHLARDVGATGPEADQYDDWLAEILDNRRWRMGVIARVLAGLDDPAFMEGDRTLLDNSLMLVTSEFSNGSKHYAANQPVLLAGGAGGALQTGRYLDYNQYAAADPNTLQYDSNESIHNLFVSILQLFGQDDTSFGSADAIHEGPLPGLV
ncbi:MAG: DUF1552 domain-containing protein [Myxococcota bacterium]